METLLKQKTESIFNELKVKWQELNVILHKNNEIEISGIKNRTINSRIFDSIENICYFELQYGLNNGEIDYLITNNETVITIKLFLD